MNHSSKAFHFGLRAGMGFPSSPDTKIRSHNDATAVARYLDKKCGVDHYKIWNLSEEVYDTMIFHDRVVTVHFPGYASPPLGLLGRLCLEIERWINQDPENIAVVHCMTGRGRSAVLLACAMAWMGYSQTPLDALLTIADKRGMDIKELVSPSQVGAFANEPQFVLLTISLLIVASLHRDASCSSSLFPRNRPCHILPSHADPILFLF